MNMKQLKYIILVLCFAGTLSSCKEWLEVYPQNNQVSDSYWSSKEDVEAVINSGYFYLRNMVQTSLIPWGELRAGCIYSRNGNVLQDFRVKSTNETICNWGELYQIINVANSVIANAERVQKKDNTYKIPVMKAHQAEALFLRALCYFYIVRNWRDAPLILTPYETDANTFQVAKSSEAELIAQIKLDLTTAINSGATKEYYEVAWESKGRATKWAMYALMADVCLWSEDYPTAIQYCNGILNAQTTFCPKFLSTPTHAAWFSMFNPGNSNESIFEIQWNYENYQTNSLPVLFDNTATGRVYEYTPRMLSDFNTEYSYTQDNQLEAVRTMFGGYYVSDVFGYESATNGFVWKYCGSKIAGDKRTSNHYDPHFILYRVADVVLMKAEALVLNSSDSTAWDTAVKLINQVRKRSNLEERYVEISETSEETMLEYILYERKMELAAEGKYWYDLLRFGRRNNNKYKELFLINNVLDYNNSASSSWIRSVLNNDDALFLPVWENELKTNQLLEQNPYYK